MRRGMAGGRVGVFPTSNLFRLPRKPNFNIGQQIGGPLAGSIFYNSSGAFSQNNDFWNKFRFESSGSFRGTTYGIAPPVKDYVNNNRIDINSFTKLEFLATPRDTFRIRSEEH